MIDSYTAERNARLLLQLLNTHKANDFGAISGFFEVGDDWRCPSCLRSKPEQARIDKNNNLMCALHWHHDHYEECISDHMRQSLRGAGAAMDALRDSIIRFPRTLICNDCNVAEPWAKNIVGAPEVFSFTPYEIATFIRVENNQSHVVDPDKALAAYAAAEPSMKLISQRLRELQNAVRDDTGDWQHVSKPLFQVIHNTRLTMKGKGQ
jgi:hypothetical protein